MEGNEFTVRGVMQREFVAVSPRDRLDWAEEIMRLGRIRHLPVLEEERLVGIVSHRDVLAASLSRVLEFEPMHRRAFLHAIEIREVMVRDVITVSPEEPLGEAARLMIERKIGCLPVVEPDGRMVGLVTETDLMRAAYLPQLGRREGCGLADAC